MPIGTTSAPLALMWYHIHIISDQMRTGELVNDTKHSPVLPNTEDSTIVDTAIVAHCRVNMLLKLTKDAIY